MTEHEFKQLVRNSTGSFRKAAAADLARIGYSAVLQKQQDAHHEGSEGQTTQTTVADNKTRPAKKDGVTYASFRASVVIRLPNKLRRDPDGMLSAILDCLTRARRRCMDPLAGDKSKMRIVRARKRRSGDNDNTAVGPPPF